MQHLGTDKPKEKYGKYFIFQFNSPLIFTDISFEIFWSTILGMLMSWSTRGTKKSHSNEIVFPCCWILTSMILIWVHITDRDIPPIYKRKSKKRHYIWNHAYTWVPWVTWRGMARLACRRRQAVFAWAAGVCCTWGFVVEPHVCNGSWMAPCTRGAVKALCVRSL